MIKFATYITDSYAIGTMALIRSMQANSKLDGFKFVVVSEGVSDNSKTKLKGIKPDIEFIERVELGDIRLPEAMNVSDRQRLMMRKLMMLKLENDAEIIGIDSDMLCVGKLKELEAWKHFTAPMVFGISLPRSICGRPMFSASIECFKPGNDFFQEVQEFVLTRYTANLPPLEDQMVMNEFMYSRHGDEVRLVGIEFDMLKRIFVHHLKVWDSVNDKRFIDFVGKKPWQGGEKGYETLERIWRDYA